MNVKHLASRAVVRVSSPDRRVWADIDEWTVWNRETALHEPIARKLVEAREHGVNGLIEFRVTVSFGPQGERIEKLEYETVRS